MGLGGWDWAAIVAGVILLGSLAFLWRLRLLASRVGSFECGLSHPGKGGWFSGIGSFGGEELVWHRLMSIRLRPHYRFQREDLEIVGVHPRSISGRVVDVTCTYRSEHVNLAMPSESYNALVSWMEAAAPKQSELY
ncbi:Protein of uncharacterised function (DUF2550) [Actinomyces bovis]|uniref:Protein of uncharacterized function (DUF2550) n=1 Tax=Actinomyces bovis TaxID=1658 RepID=A0ABY1VLV0_9ACTO|nr:DUF2550 family protein [Actinomyces bovis]SPT52793.1 Protein of uncharacterised function (DUF2550) [Actinomyces bovis]VEG54829.1 Protein of uncharacterised function (DUF2550) [Actinomyces israelii]